MTPGAAPEPPAAYAEPAIRPGFRWALAQLIPSPQWTWVGSRGPWFGVRWQVTPLLYSVGIHRGLSRWRFFVVEPNVRHSGSFEAFLSPEYNALPGPFERGLVARAGARMYVPLVQNGDYLSCSAGASATFTSEGFGGAIEVGVYTLAGVLGLQLTHSPAATPAPAPRARTTTLTLSVRYF